MNEAQVNLITKIIVESATLDDFAEVSREYENIVDFFSLSAATNNSAANILRNFGKRVDIFSSSRIDIRLLDKPIIYSLYQVYKERFPESGESGYFVRFPDGHSEQMPTKIA
jgi:hypothetical protein